MWLEERLPACMANMHIKWRGYARNEHTAVPAYSDDAVVEEGMPNHRNVLPPLPPTMQGRMCTLMKRQGPSLAYLEQVGWCGVPRV